MSERTIQQELCFACKEVISCARVGGAPASDDEVIISHAVFQMVIRAVERAKSSNAIKAEQAPE